MVAAESEFSLVTLNSIEEYTLSTIAIADRQIFLRTSDHLYRIGL